MKMPTISDSEKKLLFIVLSLLMLVCAYFFGFKKLTDAAIVIENSNVQDQALLTELQNMVAKQEQTKQETAQYKQTIQDIIDKYPVSIPQEKAIYLVEELQDTIEMDIPSIAFSMNNLVMNFSGEDAPSGRFANLSLPFSCTYEEFKNLLQYVADYPDRTTVPNINLSFDQTTGNLSGTLSYKMYYLTNTDKEYEELPPLEIEKGVDNIFRTVEE